MGIVSAQRWGEYRMIHEHDETAAMFRDASPYFISRGSLVWSLGGKEEGGGERRRKRAYCQRKKRPVVCLTRICRFYLRNRGESIFLICLNLLWVGLSFPTVTTRKLVLILGGLYFVPRIFLAVFSEWKMAGSFLSDDFVLILIDLKTQWNWK